MLFTPIKPMLLSMHKEAFDDDNFIFEPKWDGWRILIHKHGDRIEAYTRQGNCVTCKFPELQLAMSSIDADTAILDCEGICLREGRSVFDDFAYRGLLSNPHKIEHAMESHPVTFVVFDVLHVNGTDCTGMDLTERKRILHEVVQPSSVILPTLYVDGSGIELKRMTEERDWEGIVAKKKSARYQVNTRSTDWLKIKNWKTADVVILGYRTQPQFGMVVGLHFKTAHNKPVATVEFGFKPEEKRAFLRIAKELHTVKTKDVQWIEPRLCARIQYLERTERHLLRIATFKEFLFDKKPDECYWVS